MRLKPKSIFGIQSYHIHREMADTIYEDVAARDCNYGPLPKVLIPQNANYGKRAALIVQLRRVVEESAHV